MSDPYRRLVADLPRPTPEQTRRFVDFVADAHSWYKHLPIWPPGAPFIFFLDPNAGRVFVHLRTGEKAFVDRTDEKDRFHYTWMFTSEYRERFGFWNYFTDRGTSFLIPTGSGTGDTRLRARVLDLEGEWLGLSDDLVAESTCMLTGLVHRLFTPSIAFDERRWDWSGVSPETTPLVAFKERLAHILAHWEEPDGGPAFKALKSEMDTFHESEEARLREVMHATLLRALARLDVTRS